MNKEENKAIFKEKEWWWLLNTSISLRRLFSMIENERKLTMENVFLANCWFWKIVWSALNFVLKEEGEAWKVQYYYLMDGGLKIFFFGWAQLVLHGQRGYLKQTPF